MVMKKLLKKSENQGGNETENVEKDKADGTSERREVSTQKERRTKKRNDRPSSSDDDDHAPLSARIPIKR
jgi:hypothetical protein